MMTREQVVRQEIERERMFTALQSNVLMQMRFDANETLFLERELTQLRQKLFEVIYPASIARTFAPKAGDIAPSAETYSYKVYDVKGKAALIAYKAGDLPRVDVVSREVYGKVRPIGASYGWDINELRESARLGLTLPEVKARAARDFIERGIDQILAFGAIVDDQGAFPDVGLNGLVNNADVIALTGLPSGLAGLFSNPAGAVWSSSLTPTQVLNDLSTIIRVIPQDSLNVFNANTVLMPTFYYEYASQTPFSTLTGLSIMEVFKRNNPQVTQVAPWYKLDTAGAGSSGGTGGKPRIMAYQKDPMIMESIIPQEFEVMPPEMKNLEFINNCHARCGGVKIYQPLGVRYMDMG